MVVRSGGSKQTNWWSVTAVQPPIKQRLWRFEYDNPLAVKLRLMVRQFNHFNFVGNYITYGCEVKNRRSVDIATDKF